MTDPSPGGPDPRLTRYHIAQLGAVQRADQRFRWIYFSLAAVGFVAGLLVMSQITPDGGVLGVFGAVGFAIVAGMAGLVVAPRVANPSLTCPFCGGRIPLFDLTKKLPPLDFTSRCGNCARDIPPAV